ncbi:C40 family peptidase [Salinimicrobium xinjiangense]|uniref:C40 family peptidase n=1 Tax=Salinimicrobium xinjiangense TaxID=438596 RepID=UPI0004122683|nr:SH3 domain-containing protein [Salinimicrobium xinjiangense]
MINLRTLKNFGFAAVFSGLLFTACNSNTEEGVVTATEADAAIEEVRQQHAPDKRVALFDIEAVKRENELVLRGESNMPGAIEDLKQKLAAENVKFTDSIQLLPASELEGKTEGVVPISVANLRSKPSHSSELVTQATLGTPLKVYKKEGGWYYVQTPDGYLAWVDYGGVTSLTPQEFQTWKASEKIIYLEPYGFSYSKPDKDSDVVTDLVSGNIFEVTGEKNGFYEVKYPNNKMAYVAKSDAQPYLEWVASLEPTGENLIKTAREMMGVPYLWGGTSSKGVDCSGYTKTIFFLNGMVIPRDASQQIAAGEEIDSVKNFENLQAGDLLYFGRKATDTTSERIIHVGMWIGDNKFIHSMGEVHESNFDTTATDFDEYNYNRYLRTKRVLGTNDERIIYLAQSDLFTDGNREFKN